MNDMLFDTPPIIITKELADLCGLHQAHILQQIYYLMETDDDWVPLPELTDLYITDLTLVDQLISAGYLYRKGLPNRSDLSSCLYQVNVQVIETIEEEDYE